MSRRRTGVLDRWRQQLAVRRGIWRDRLLQARRWPAAAAVALRDRWGYLSLVLLVVLTLLTVDLVRENRVLRARVSWYTGREAAEPEKLPGALTERTPEPPSLPAPEPAPATEAAPPQPAVMPVMAAAVRPEEMHRPVTGQELRGFGWYWSATHEDWRHHQGMDFRAPEGAEVRAALPGKVQEVRRDRLWGHVVELDHGGNLRTVYAHLTRVGVRAGDEVPAGQVLGRVGPPGDAELADGFHLHFELRRDGKPVDPGAYLK